MTADESSHLHLVNLPPGGTGDRERPPRPTTRFRRPALALAALVVLLSGVFAATHYAAPHAQTSRAVATTAATATSTAIPTTLYQADWSQGTGGWTLPAGWKAGGGQLTIDGGNEQVAVPYVVTARRYTVEIDIDVRAGAYGSAANGFFGLLADDTGGARLYSAMVSCSHAGDGCVGAAWVNAEQPRDLIAGGANSAMDFSSGTGSKPYLVVVASDSASDSADLCANGACVGAMASAVPLAPAHLLIYAHNVQLTVTRFVITSP